MHDNLLTVTQCKIKIKKQVTYFQHTMAQDIHYHPKRVEREHGGKYWAKARPKTSWTNSKLCISTSDDKTLFRPPTPFSFVDCHTLLSLGLVPLPVSSSPQQVSHSSGIPQHLGVSKAIQASLSQLHAVASLGLHAGTFLTRLASVVFLRCGGRFHNLLLVFLTLKSEPCN